MCHLGACPRGHHTCLVPTALPRAPFELSMGSASGVRVFWVGVEFARGSDALTKLTIGTGFRQLPTGLGECQLSRGGHSTAAAVRSSSGEPQLTNAFLFALKKAVVVLFAPCFCLSRSAGLSSWRPHSLAADVPDPSPWLPP
jgi:hypothetical protein